MWVNNDATTDSFSRRGQAQNVMVTTGGDDRMVKFELNKGVFTLFEFFCTQKPQLGRCFSTTDKDFNLVLENTLDAS